MEPVEISAGRLHLRPWQAGDEPVLLELGLDPQARRCAALPSPSLPEHAAAYVAGTAPAGWASGRAPSWAVCDSTTSQVLAHVGLAPGCHDGAWEAAYWCLPSARGRGVVPQALQAVCRWAFAELAAARIECRGEAGSRAARRAAEKAGFRVEGAPPGSAAHGGARVDGWIGGLLPGDPARDTAGGDRPAAVR